MNRFKKILVVVGSEPDAQWDLAVERATDLAKRNGASLTLISVIGMPTGLVQDFGGIISIDELVSLKVAEREAQVGQLAEQLRLDGINCAVQVTTGKDHIEVIRHALLNQHDLILKSTEPQKSAFNSCDLHLMRKSPIPVWLIKPNRVGRSKNIVAAVDLAMEHTDEGYATNRLILDLATSIAEIEDCRATLLSCWNLYAESSLRHSGFVRVTHEQIEKMLAAEKERHAKLQEELNAAYGNRLELVLIKGDPKQQIVKYVNQHNIDIAVMGTVGRTGIGGLLIGNTAETVLQGIESSVLTVKPSSFISPVQPSE